MKPATDLANNKLALGDWVACGGKWDVDQGGSSCIYSSNPVNELQLVNNFPKLVTLFHTKRVVRDGK